MISDIENYYYPVYIGEEMCADCKSPFSYSPSGASSIVSSDLNFKNSKKKVYGTATILPILEMLQQYKNSGNVAYNTDLITVKLAYVYREQYLAFA